jgi:hypothetical protein
MAKKGRRLSKRDLAKQHAADLPNREAMSLLASGLPTLPPIGAAGPYAAGAQELATAQTDTAGDAVESAPATGTNNPNSTATSVSRT